MPIAPIPISPFSERPNDGANTDATACTVDHRRLFLFLLLSKWTFRQVILLDLLCVVALSMTEATLALAPSLAKSPLSLDFTIR